MASNIVEGTVEELRDAVHDLLKDEDARAQSLNGRATGLTGFVGVILSVAAAAGAVGAPDRAGGLTRSVELLVALLVAIALAALVSAVVIVVVKVLLPSPGLRIATSEVERYPTYEFVTQPRVMIQGRLLRGYVEALARDRERNEMKARWLKLSYVVVTFGLALVSLAGVVATIGRYASDDDSSAIEHPTGEWRAGERAVAGGFAVRRAGSRRTG
jgi:hypothetical protein